VSDPAAELAGLSTSGPTVTAAFLEGYGVLINTDLFERLARYASSGTLAPSTRVSSRRRLV